jgi:hypothetical protein
MCHLAYRLKVLDSKVGFFDDGVVITGNCYPDKVPQSNIQAAVTFHHNKYRYFLKMIKW